MKILGFLYVNLSDFVKRDIVKVGFVIGVKKKNRKKGKNCFYFFFEMYGRYKCF